MQSHWFCITEYKEKPQYFPNYRNTKYHITERNKDLNLRIYKENPVHS